MAEEEPTPTSPPPRSHSPTFAREEGHVEESRARRDGEDELKMDSDDDSEQILRPGRKKKMVPWDPPRVNRPRVLKGAGAAFLCVAVVAVVLLAVYAKKDGPSAGAGRGQGRFALKLDDILDGMFNSEKPHYAWAPGTSSLTVLQRDDSPDSGGHAIVELRVESETGGPAGEPLVTVQPLVFTSSLNMSATYEPFNISSYAVAADRTALLVTADHASRWRHSETFNAYVVALDADAHAEPPTDGSMQLWPVVPPSGDAAGKLQLAVWSPRGHKLAVVLGNNVGVVDAPGTGVPPRMLTSDGSDEVLNGVADWLYEEEVLADSAALWWSPEGGRVAWLRFDQADVPQFPLMRVGNVYPSVEFIRYPTPGYPNANVTVHVWDASMQAPVRVTLPPTGDHYISGVTWLDEDTLVVHRLERDQQREESFLLTEAAQWTATAPWRVRTADAWLEPPTPLLRVNEQSALTVLLGPDGDYQHIALVMRSNGLVDHYVTSGKWDVTELCAYNRELNLVFFLGTQAGPTQRHLYSQSLVDSTGPRRITEGTGWFGASFSRDGARFVLEYHGPDVPRYEFRTAEHALSNAFVIEDNAELTTKLADYALPRKLFSTFIAGDGKTELNGYVLVPKSFESGSGGDYPVLMQVYGGPGSQTVHTRFSMGWDEYLASQGILVVSVDGRGTGARGYKFMTQTYRNLGDLEVQDQIAVANQLQDFNYVDADRIGLWGWSFGGYMTSKVLTKAPRAIKMGMAVAPVTDWRFYDSAYTERYMSTPADNPDGYRNSNVTADADQLTAHYLVVHGTGDDNVHFQNTELLVQGLVHANVTFQTMFYPNMPHSMGGHGSDSYSHLIYLLTDFVRKYLVAED